MFVQYVEGERDTEVVLADDGDLALEHWGSGSGSGCCGSCCKRSFDDDDFEKEEARLHGEALTRERERDRATAATENGADNGGMGPKKSQEVISAQPAAAKSMEQPRRSSSSISLPDPREARPAPAA